jgi:ABC-2 type transport system permease protein
MIAAFRNSIGRARGQIIGWGLAIFLLGLIMVPFYDAIAEQGDVLIELLAAYPEEMTVFFGDMSQLTTPEGYINAEYFMFMPLILGIYAVLVCSGLLASQEENGVLDLILAHPISRTSLFVGRLLAFVVTTLIILAMGWFGILLPMNWSTMDIPAADLVLAFLSLLAVVLIFGAIALLFSMVLPSRRMAAMVAGLLLVVSFFITGLSRISDDLEAIASFSPWTYYQGGEAISGFNGEWFFGLLVVALAFAALALLMFTRRDIRVGGEGGWQIPFVSRLLSARARRQAELVEPTAGA